MLLFAGFEPGGQIREMNAPAAASGVVVAIPVLTFANASVDEMEACAIIFHSQRVILSGSWHAEKSPLTISPTLTYTCSVVVINLITTTEQDLSQRDERHTYRFGEKGNRQWLKPFLSLAVPVASVV